MATLGEMLASARSASTISRWLAGADPHLAASIRAAALQEGETLDVFARIVVADFTRDADEEAWTTLVSRIRNAPDPALACLSEMMRWRLSLGEQGSARMQPRQD